jgi:hypothetical protein
VTRGRQETFAYPPRPSRVRFRRSPRGAAELWEAVAALVADLEGTGALEANGLHLLAAHHRRALGLPVDPGLVAEERRNASARLFAVPLLRRVRATVGGALILVGGPDLAERYPSIEARPLSGMTLLTDDVSSAARRLALAGFGVRQGDGTVTVEAPNAPAVTLRSALPWLAGRSSPGVDELFATSRVSPIGVSGILAPAPAVHALLLAVACRARHATLAIDLLDVAALLTIVSPGDVERLARSWRVLRPWNETEAAIETLLRSPSVRPEVGVPRLALAG